MFDNGRTRRSGSGGSRSHGVVYGRVQSQIKPVHDLSPSVPHSPTSAFRSRPRPSVELQKRLVVTVRCLVGTERVDQRSMLPGGLDNDVNGSAAPLTGFTGRSRARTPASSSSCSLDLLVASPPPAAPSSRSSQILVPFAAADAQSGSDALAPVASVSNRLSTAHTLDHIDGGTRVVRATTSASSIFALPLAIS